MTKLLRRPRAQRFVLDLVPWKGYLHQLRAFEGRHVRVTFDRGRLEIMTTSPRHERNKHLLGQLVVTLLQELGRDYAC